MTPGSAWPSVPWPGSLTGYATWQAAEASARASVATTNVRPLPAEANLGRRALVGRAAAHRIADPVHDPGRHTEDDVAWRRVRRRRVRSGRSKLLGLGDLGAEVLLLLPAQHRLHLGEQLGLFLLVDVMQQAVADLLEDRHELRVVALHAFPPLEQLFDLRVLLDLLVDQLVTVRKRLASRRVQEHLLG